MHGALPGALDYTPQFREWAREHENDARLGFMLEDITTLTACDGGFNLIVSDASVADSYTNNRELELILRRVLCNDSLLAPGGCLIVKARCGYHYSALTALRQLAPHFDDVIATRPPAVRPTSGEIYLVAINFAYKAQTIGPGPLTATLYDSWTAANAEHLRFVEVYLARNRHTSRWRRFQNQTSQLAKRRVIL